MATQAGVSTLLLRNVPLFAMLPADQLATIASVASRKSFARGATVIAAGEVGSTLYVVISGRLKVIMSNDANREIILSLLGKGEYFGEMVPIDDNTRSASVITLEPCELLVLSNQAFRKCLSENFEMAMTVMRCLVKRLRDADRKIGSLALMDVYGRVAQLLLEMSETIDGEQVVTRKIVKQDIANMIGASREMVSRVMKDLQVRGLIDVRGKTTHLRDNIANID
ncbi:MAG: hypothetical protein A3G25_18000 [Betaproteobacteria bacterium RIFCSPLOWO2_12_FULL_63_13]|nr:MAG: hypothetical protein A3G25_18000 [Betaproteobacteria bacterium RIFCSPLOWO2_12_FULL_63_13]